MRPPSQRFARFVEKYAARIPDPAQKLKFLRLAVAAYQPLPLVFERALGPNWFAWRYTVVGSPPRLLRRRPLGAGGACIICLLVIAVVLVGPGTRAARAGKAAKVQEDSSTAAPGMNSTGPDVWLVEQTPQHEIYSNGLRIENEFSSSTERRRYRALARDTGQPSGWRTEPAGIVFHTTESQMAPFEPSNNDWLKRNGVEALAYARHKHAYHFIIDRFGRVFRIVAETDYANHAGRSVWADANWIYMNLNQSFFGVAFEIQTKEAIHPPYGISEAQIHAAKILTQLLRSRYRLAESNCVTHAQVSVNPEKMLIGYHTDWASHFPFQEAGLAISYEIPPAAITEFGFAYDAGLLQAMDGQVWNGLVKAEQQLVAEAARQQMTPGAFRKLLQKRYRETTLALRNSAANQEKIDDGS